LYEANEDVWDAPGCFPEESADIKHCFSALLKIVADLLAWKGFLNSVHKKLLKGGYQAGWRK